MYNQCLRLTTRCFLYTSLTLYAKTRACLIWLIVYINAIPHAQFTSGSSAISNLSLRRQNIINYQSMSTLSCYISCLKWLQTRIVRQYYLDVDRMFTLWAAIIIRCEDRMFTLWKCVSDRHSLLENSMHKSSWNSSYKTVLRTTRLFTFELYIKFATYYMRLCMKITLAFICFMTQSLGAAAILIAQYLHIVLEIMDLIDYS